MMKTNYYLAVFFFAVCSCAFAQTPMTVAIDDSQEVMGDVAIRSLEGKVNALLSSQGMKTDMDFAQFLLQLQPVVTNKEVLTGMRPKVIMTLDMNLSILNQYTGQSIAGESFSVSGSGVNENKAIIQAASSMGSSNSQMKAFISNAEKKIISFYEQRMSGIISQAKLFAQQRNYSQALTLMISIPTGCKNYAQAETALVNIYQQYIDYDGTMRLQRARSLWNASQNAESAAEVANLLSGIDPSSNAWPQINELQQEIKARIGEEWTFEKKVYQDGIDLKKQQIDAARQIGVAYGNHQQAKTYSNYWVR